MFNENVFFLFFLARVYNILENIINVLICNELRKHLQETLIEIINVKDSRKNELVECNKDLTRLQMSMKPLFIYANNI